MTSKLQNKGVVKTAVGNASVQSIPIPRLRDDYILVKTIAVALNPTDWQTVDEGWSPRVKGNTLLGCDFAGIVMQVGKGVTKKWETGDRIAGFAHGGSDIEPEDGTFAFYIMVKGDIAFHIPTNISFEQAASLACGALTATLGLYKYMALPLLTFPLSSRSPDNEFPILIYGGSSATGTLAIQFAKISGLEVITTSSPRNFKLLKSLGADHVLDYHDPSCSSQIRQLTQNNLHHIFDTIATLSSSQICLSALSTSTSSSHKNIYINLMGIDIPPQEIPVENIFFLGYSITGEEYEIEGNVWPAAPEDFEFAKRVFDLLEKLLEEEDIRNHPIRVMDGGLEGILGGMRELKEGRVSGEKLVYRVGEP